MVRLTIAGLVCRVFDTRADAEAFMRTIDPEYHIDCVIAPL